jgi:hypothetical protein
VVDAYVKALESQNRAKRNASREDSSTSNTSASNSGFGEEDRPRGWLIHGFPRTKGQLLLLNQRCVFCLPPEGGKIRVFFC